MRSPPPGTSSHSTTPGSEARPERHPQPSLRWRTRPSPSSTRCRSPGPTFSGSRSAASSPRRSIPCAPTPHTASSFSTMPNSLRTSRRSWTSRLQPVDPNPSGRAGRDIPERSPTVTYIPGQPTGGRSDVTVVLVHGAFADASSWTGVIELLQQRGHTVVAPPNPLRGLAAGSAYLASVLGQIDGPVLLVGHSYGGAVITNAAAGNVRGLVYVAAFAPDEGEVLGAVASGSRDSVLNTAQVPRRYPTGPAGQTATEFAIDPAQLHDV